MKTFLKYVLLFICFGIGVGFAIATVQDFGDPYRSSDTTLEGVLAALFLLGALLLFRWKPSGTSRKGPAPPGSDWLQKKNEKQVPIENAVGPYELGRHSAVSAIADIEAYMQARWYPAIQGLVDVVYGKFESPDLPPLVLARADLKNFLERLDGELRPKILPELRSVTAGWVEIAKQASAGAEFERLIEHHYIQWKSNVVLAAFQRFLDIADLLKEADDKWRAANPKMAAEIPFDCLGPELGDLVAPYLKNSGTFARI
jgi:hypothetical protein